MSNILISGPGYKRRRIYTPPPVTYWFRKHLKRTFSICKGRWVNSVGLGAFDEAGSTAADMNIYENEVILVRLQGLILRLMNEFPENNRHIKST